MKKLILASFLAFLTAFLTLSAKPTHANPLLLPAANFLMNRVIAGVLVSTLVARGLSENDQKISKTLSQIAAVLSGANRSDNPRAALISAGGVPLWIGLLASLVQSKGLEFLAANELEAISLKASNQGGLVVKFNDRYPDFPEKHEPLPPLGEEYWFEKRLMQKGLRVYLDGEWEVEEKLKYLPIFKYGYENRHWLGKFFTYDSNVIIVANSIDELKIYYETYCLLHGRELPISVDITWHMNEYFYKCIFSTSNDPHQGNFVGSISDHFDTNRDAFPRQTSVESLIKAQREPNSKQMPLENETVGNIVNAVWQVASARPDYDGVPHISSIPISASDVGNWRNKNPGIQPVLSDLFLPASNDPQGIVPISVGGNVPTSKNLVPGTATIPHVEPGTGSGARPIAPPVTTPVAVPGDTAGSNVDEQPVVIGDVNVINEPTVRLANPVQIETGEVPNAVVPALEATPTARSILTPILQMLPGLKSWEAPSHSGLCPRPTLEVFQQVIRMDAMCDIAEQNRSALHASLLVVFALAAMLIVLSA